MDVVPQRMRMGSLLGQREHNSPFFSPGGYRIKLGIPDKVWPLQGSPKISKSPEPKYRIGLLVARK